MLLETEAVLDRRALKRKLSGWRTAFVVLGALAIGGAVASLSGSSLFGSQRHIARVTIEGLITEDRAQLQMLERLGRSADVAGVILAVNSGGGTTTGGEALFETIRTIAKTKPVVAQFGTVAASAAYICGLAADHIVARSNTITGSVGVLVQWPEISGLLDKVGVKVNEIKSGPLKAVPSIFEPVSPAGRASTEKMIAESQGWFLGLVKERRKIDTLSVPGLEQGRVFSGREALSFKLVDTLGGEPEAIRWLETQPGVSPKLRVIDWRPMRRSTGTIAGWLGDMVGAGWSELVGQHAVLSQLDTLKSRMALDGLVSVWQPHEK